MFSKIQIENYRRFQSFELSGLGRVNLLVGENNSGKTSILEAINSLCSPGEFFPILRMLERRGEIIISDNKSDVLFDVRRLFHGHKIPPENFISIMGLHNLNHKYLLEILIRKKENKGASNGLGLHFNLDESAFSQEDMSLVVSWDFSGNKYQAKKRLLEGGYLSLRKRLLRSVQASHTQFIHTAAMGVEETMSLFDAIVLSPAEEIVYNALRMIEPGIRRIASISSASKYHQYTKIQVLVLLENGQKIPIGSLGDGIWRVLGLTLAIINSKNGYLLVDEIDSGLHFSTMSDMWKVVLSISKKLNVQVFATTHSNDCWTSLAEVAEEESVETNEVSIQRIEKEGRMSVTFSKSEMIYAADLGVEVR